MYKNIGIKPSYPDDNDLPKDLEGLSLVNVKKLNEGLSESNDKDIYNYAKNDAEFLIKQIKLINPNIILCCNTGDGYFDWLRNDESNDDPVELTRNNNDKIHTYNDNNILFIDYWHPSNRKNNEILYDDLCELLENGKVFNEFNW